ncbi:hypothetical protein [Sphingomonas sp.]
MHHYRIGELHVRSDIPLVAADAVPVAARDSVDVAIVVRDAAAPGAVVPRAGAWPDATADDFGFNAMPGLTFRITGGRRIEIARAASVDDADVLLYLTGSAWGVLCYQRGWLPLHCSAVAVGARAVAFTGVSGAGKSTLTAGMAQRGWPLLCDDTCVVDPADPRMIVRGAPKETKLWRDAIDALGLTPGAAVGNRLQRDKYYAPRTAGPVPDAAGLAVIYILGWSEDGDAAIAPVTGAETVAQLYQALYRAEWALMLRDAPALFAQVAQMAGRLRVFRFDRPRDFARFDAGLALLQAHMVEQVGAGTE